MTEFRRAFRLDRTTGADVRSAVSDELQHHLELAAEELMETGWGEEEAWAEARRRFGDVEETRAYCERVQREREERRKTMMSTDELRQDVRYALRSIRRAPGYAGLVILTLAFGIAANTTIFSVMNPYLLRALPFEDPDELVQVNVVNPVTGWDMDRFSYPQYADWKARSRAFDDLAAYVYGSATVTGAEAAEQIQYTRLTPNMLHVLGVRVARGRGLLPEDGGPGAEPVVLLDHGLWERRYNADPDVLGRPITIDGVQHTVVGIMPADFEFPFGEVKLWLPTEETVTADRSRRAYQLVGRLADGWTAERAHQELVGIQGELSRTYPEADGRMAGVTVKPLREALNFAWDEINVLFRVLLGAVCFVLLLACVNVASLTLAKASARVREMSVRAAMGAPRGRIVRQLFTESAVLALVAGAIGLGLTHLVTAALDPLVPEALFKVGGVRIDLTVLAFSLAITMATPVVFGLLPALTAARTDLVSGLKEGTKGSGGTAASRGRRALVVAQVALAVILITGAGLTLRSFASVRTLDMGLDPGPVATVEVTLPARSYESGEERRTFMREAVGAVRRIPGVSSASAVQWLPLNHETMSEQVAPMDLLGTPGDEWPLATYNRVHPGYFETMSIEVLSGRDFSPDDRPDTEPVVIVNRRLAERFWPEGDAVGQTLLIREPESPRTASVVGVVEEVYHTDLDPDGVGPQIYEPALQTGARRFFLVARTPGDPAGLAPSLRSTLTELAPDLPVEIRPMRDVVAENQFQWSLSSLALAIFGAGALLLATLGIYGLVAYSVAQRKKELGVRVALGASAGEIRRRVVGDGLKLTTMGLAIGLTLAVALGRFLAAVLYGVPPADPVTLGAVLVLFFGVSGLASLVPAVRASRTSPTMVLRTE